MFCASQAEAGVGCPISMTYSAIPALRKQPEIAAEWEPRFTSLHYDGALRPASDKPGALCGMGMTEKQGGSDVRANTTTATPLDGGGPGAEYEISGHKWFFSAPMCDAFLVLAQAEGGLSCFFMPRFTPEGERNAIHIQRLKDKLGNRSNASSEVEFRDAWARLVGEEGRGVPTIIEMVNHTRLDCCIGAAAGMRSGVANAIHHTSQRSAFGKLLIDQPLMKNVLADLALESEAATALALRLARAVDRTENGQDADGHEALMRRVLTPIAKFWICKRGSVFAQEAMECLGGNGYVEERGEGAMARVYREMPLNSIWEGAGNIMALDLLRALRTGPVADALLHELQPARASNGALDRLAASLPARVDGSTDETAARRLARDVALAVQAALLKQHAPSEVFDTFCASRLGDQLGGGGAFGLLDAHAPLHALITRASPR
jgi:putative acyl-CoA dehydrogenase